MILSKKKLKGRTSIWKCPPTVGSDAAAEINLGFGMPHWQLETKLPQSQTDAKGVDG